MNFSSWNIPRTNIHICKDRRPRRKGDWIGVNKYGEFIIPLFTTTISIWFEAV